jgi:hypothetical protein
LNGTVARGIGVAVAILVLIAVVVAIPLVGDPYYREFRLDCREPAEVTLGSILTPFPDGLTLLVGGRSTGPVRLSYSAPSSSDPPVEVVLNPEGKLDHPINFSHLGDWYDSEMHLRVEGSQRRCFLLGVYRFQGVFW